MIVDLHLHTAKYSKCSKMREEDLINAAIAKGLDGIVITEHDHVRSIEEITALREQYKQIKIFNGIEVSIKEDEHVLVYGKLTPDLYYYHMPMIELEKAVKRDNAVMVLAHPFRYKDFLLDEVINSDIIGLEVASINVKEHMLKGYKELLGKKELVKVAGSDAHSIEMVGLAATQFKNNINTDTELAEAIREGNLSYYKDSAGFDWLNAYREDRILIALRLIEIGFTDSKISELVGRDITFSDVRALRKGKNVTYRIK